MVKGFEPARPQLPKQHHQLGTECSNIGAYGASSLNPQGHPLQGAVLYVMGNEITVSRLSSSESVLAEHRIELQQGELCALFEHPRERQKRPELGEWSWKEEVQLGGELAT